MYDPHRVWKLERLLGRWVFEREILGHASMVGSAAFDTMDAGRLMYREWGELQLINGSRLRGEQSYLYEGTSAGFAVYFHDTGKLFHRVDLTASEGDVWTGVAHHDCKDDVYDSEYVFRGTETFEVRHAVRGPKKDYTIRTMYRRNAR